MNKENLIIKDIQLNQSTGEQKEQLIQFKTKEVVDHAGLSQQWLQWKEHTKLNMVNFLLYLNNNLLIVIPNHTDAKGVINVQLSNMHKHMAYKEVMITLIKDINNLAKQIKEVA